MTIRITGLISNLDRGGAEKNFCALFNALQGKGYRCTVITLRESAALQQTLTPEITQRCLGWSKSSGALRLLRELKQQISNAKPDLLISFMDQTNMLALFASKKLQVPVLVCERNNPAKNLILARHWPTPIQALAKSVRNFSYRRAGSICVQTAGAAQYFKQYVPRVPCTVIPNFVEPVTGTAIKPRKKIVLGVGRLVPEKGFAELIDSFATVAQSFPDWQLHIFGEGPCREVLQLKIDRLALQQNVKLLGKIENLQPHYLEASIFVLNSQYEGFPNALLEAMASGCAVIASNCPYGPADLIKDRINGLLVPMSHPSDLAKALKYLMSEAAERIRLGSEAQASAANYSFTHYFSSFEQLMLDICATSHP